MKAATALRTFFNNGPVCNESMTYPTLNVKEIRDFKVACGDEEYFELAEQAATLLGETFER